MVTLAELKAIARPIMAEAKEKRTTYHTTGRKAGKVKEKGYTTIKLTGKKPDIAVQVVKEKAFLEGKKAENVAEEASKLLGQTIQQDFDTFSVKNSKTGAFENKIEFKNTYSIVRAKKEPKTKKEPKAKKEPKPKAVPKNENIIKGGITLDKVLERAKAVPYRGVLEPPKAEPSIRTFVSPDNPRGKFIPLMMRDD